MNNNKDQRDTSQKPTRFWIIGAGRFGRIAVERISRHIAGAAITVVDKEPISIGHRNITTINADGIGWLDRMLVQDAPVDMVVPAIPVHIAAAWLSLRLLKEYHIKALAIPNDWMARMPNALRRGRGHIFVSHADFICPDNCPEPEERCTHTGKPRPMDLFRLLAQLDFDDVLPVVLRSHQLLPGVGGLYPTDLMAALQTVRNNSRRPLMIATACRCHGVVNFLRLGKKTGR